MSNFIFLMYELPKKTTETQQIKPSSNINTVNSHCVRVEDMGVYAISSGEPEEGSNSGRQIG